MTNTKLGTLLLVALALVGLAIAAPAVSAHDDEPVQGNETAAHGDVADWAGWMEAHMTDHMGADAVDEMESHMGTTIDEMGSHMDVNAHESAHEPTDDHHEHADEGAHETTDDHHEHADEGAHETTDDHHEHSGTTGQGHGHGC